MHTHHTNSLLPGDSQVVHVVAIALAILFYAQTLYYVGRTIFVSGPGWLRPKPDTRDPDALYWLENDLGHAACMWFMAHHLAPMFAVPLFVTDTLLLFGAIWFGARPYIFSKPQSEEYRMWWDGAHSAMFVGMWLMFRPDLQKLPVLLIAQLLFWGWFTHLYAKETYKATKYRFGYFAHFDMGLVMLAMTVLVAISLALPIASHPPGDPSGDTASNSEKQTAALAVDDQTYQREVEEAGDQTVVILVWGGCEACAADARIFDGVAASVCAADLKFVKINKDKSPRSAERLGVTECPTIKLVKRGVVRPDKLEGVTDERKILTFVINRSK